MHCNGTQTQEVNIGARQRVDPALLSDEELQQKLSQVLSQASSTSFFSNMCILLCFECMRNSCMQLQVVTK
jgi:hypothetical protein